MALQSTTTAVALFGQEQEAKDALMAVLDELQALYNSDDADGLHGRRIARATFDATAGKAVGSHALGVTVPDNAVVTQAWYDVVTTFTSAGADAGTVALQVEGANDLVVAVAVSDGGNPWDAGIHACIPVGSAATSVKTTAARALTAVVAGQALTAGKLVLFVEYMVSV